LALIAFEGGEASGKSTQAARLAQRLGAVLTGEPGATALGRVVRGLVLDGSSVIDARAEALLLAADRAQHVAEVVGPAVGRGEHVVTDRFTASSLAYQGFGRGLDLDWLRRLSAWATGGLAADLVVLLDVPVEVARARLAGRPDRIEAEGLPFHARVVDGFRRLAADDPDRWVVIDGQLPVGEVARLVDAAVAARLNL
jgi:dTMP kinase